MDDYSLRINGSEGENAAFTDEQQRRHIKKPSDREATSSRAVAGYRSGHFLFVRCEGSSKHVIASGQLKNAVWPLAM
ncbi:MAG: hypothetical protein KF874_05895 [Rhizobiaceae bacterium]|nr:hypothetical protein [Rhizobiaceae bacterium]